MLISTQGAGGANAKDRIGRSSVVQREGVQVAANVADLHGDNNKINKDSALNEKGMVVNGRGEDAPDRHDILTGSQRDGTVAPGTDNTTCSNWNADGQGNAVEFALHDLIGNPQPTSGTIHTRRPAAPAGEPPESRR